MSTKYQTSAEVPNSAIVKRLCEIADFICRTVGLPSELSMRVPCELDRDADMVITIAADRITELESELSELRERRKRDCVEFFYWWFNAPGTNTEDGYDEWLRADPPEGEE